MTILDEIFTHKRFEVAARRQVWPLAEVRRAAENAAPSIDFVSTLREKLKVNNTPALIAEVKFASPSKGILLANLDPVALAQIYAENGVGAISVLTDEKYFHGHLDHLSRVHAALPQTPLLRKDFIYDAYQIYETRAAGADTVLLITAFLDPILLAELQALILSLGMTPLVEIHNHSELETALALNGRKLLGVNNRDLRTFKVDLQTCLDLRPLVPADICFVAESGIHTAADVVRLREAGVDAILVGEALVTSPDIGAKVKELSSG